MKRDKLISKLQEEVEELKRVSAKDCNNKITVYTMNLALTGQLLRIIDELKQLNE